MRVGDVLRHKEGPIPSLVHMHPEETVGEAIEVLREYGVSQMPVVKPGAGHPDVMAAEVVGSVVERELLDALFTQRASLGDQLEKHMSAAAAARRFRGVGRRSDGRPRTRRRRSGVGGGQAGRRGQQAGPAGVPGERHKK